MNAEFIARSQEVWDAVEKDRWIYNLENDDGIAPNFNKSRKSKRKRIPDQSSSTTEEQNSNNIACPDTQSDINLHDNGFGPAAPSTNVSDDIPDLMDIPESELEQ